MHILSFLGYSPGLSGECRSNGPCQHLCFDLHDGTFECACREGFTLADNGYSCVGEWRCRNAEQTRKRKRTSWKCCVATALCSRVLWGHECAARCTSNKSASRGRTFDALCGRKQSRAEPSAVSGGENKRVVILLLLALSRLARESSSRGERTRRREELERRGRARERDFARLASEGKANWAREEEEAPVDAPRRTPSRRAATR